MIFSAAQLQRLISMQGVKLTDFKMAPVGLEADSGRKLFRSLSANKPTGAISKLRNSTRLSIARNPVDSTRNAILPRAAEDPIEGA